MSVLLEAQSLTAGYGSTCVVRDLDLQVNRGEIVALLGPNGAGKTTSILTLAGALAPLGGTIRWQGVPTSAPLHVRCRSGLGLVTETRSLAMGLTTQQNLRVARVDIDLALTLFPELSDHLDRRVGLLSGGQQQMLALARALGRRPDVLLADELSLGLAPVIFDRLLQAMRAAADEGLGVLLVEQHVHKALQVADRVHVMRRGRVEMSGNAADIQLRMSEVMETYVSSNLGTTPT